LTFVFLFAVFCRSINIQCRKFVTFYCNRST